MTFHLWNYMCRFICWKKPELPTVDYDRINENQTHLDKAQESIINMKNRLLSVQFQKAMLLHGKRTPR